LRVHQILQIVLDQNPPRDRSIGGSASFANVIV
jgi:hypothetical protein